MSPYIFKNITLGGDPIGVPNPPMLAEYATPSSKATAKLELFFCKLEFSKTAKITGISINVVAVLETHILKKAEATMNPRTNVLGLSPPNKRIIEIANRLCAPLLSIAFDNIAPPINKRIRGFP